LLGVHLVPLSKKHILGENVFTCCTQHWYMYCVVPLRNVIMYIAWCTSGTVEQENIS